jgi:hypothetical protein
MYKEMTLDDIGIKDEGYQNFIPVLFAAPALVGGILSNKKTDKNRSAASNANIAAANRAAEESARVAAEKIKAEADKKNAELNKATCDELDTMLSGVMNALADEYNLNESQKEALNSQKSKIEDKQKEKKCAEERQKIAATKIAQAEQQLVKVEADKKAKQKKILTYAGLGVGGLILTIIIIKVLRQ